MKKQEEVILVTGARKGIGRFLSEQYCEEGFRVVGCSRGDSDFSHPNYTHIIADVSDELSVKSLMKEIKKKLGRIDVLLNNAGVANMNHLLLTPISAVKKLFDTNTIGSFLVARESVKLMRKSGSGRIINFTTVAVPFNLEGEAVYASSKAAVESLTKVMAKELGDFQITVNCIGPSPIQTDLIRAVPEEKIKELVSRQAIKKLAQFEDVKNVTDFFMSHQSSMISGQTIYLGGVF